MGLQKESYANPDHVAFLTFALADRRRRIFADARHAATMVDVLLERARAREVPIFVYCVMPDHVHVTIAPSAKCDVISYVRMVKSKAAHLIGLGPIWQPSFHDRMHHRHEKLDALLTYTLMNPVRAGLVERCEDYAFAGVPPPELRTAANAAVLPQD